MRSIKFAIELAIFGKTCYTQKVRGHVAQWIEHQVPVLRVGGSNPSVLILINIWPSKAFTAVMSPRSGFPLVFCSIVSGQSADEVYLIKRKFAV